MFLFKLMFSLKSDQSVGKDDCDRAPRLKRQNKERERKVNEWKREGRKCRGEAGFLKAPKNDGNGVRVCV